MAVCDACGHVMMEQQTTEGQLPTSLVSKRMIENYDNGEEAAYNHPDLIIVDAFIRSRYVHNVPGVMATVDALWQRFVEFAKDDHWVDPNFTKPRLGKRLIQLGYKQLRNTRGQRCYALGC